MDKARIYGLAVDMRMDSPVLILKPFDDASRQDIVLPIWIGPYEAMIIAAELAGQKLGRPIPHDLIKAIVQKLKLKLVKVEVSSLQGATYVGKIYLMNNDQQPLTLDARPSDSVILALKASIPIFVNPALWRQASQIFKTSQPSGQKDSVSQEDSELLKERLRQARPEEFGSFHMPQ